MRLMPELYHHGIKGMKWGVRRYQNKDGSLTLAGQRRYGIDNSRTLKSGTEVQNISRRKLNFSSKKSNRDCIESFCNHSSIKIICNIRSFCGRRNCLPNFKLFSDSGSSTNADIFFSKPFPVLENIIGQLTTLYAFAIMSDILFGFS